MSDTNKSVITLHKAGKAIIASSALIGISAGVIYHTIKKDSGHKAHPGAIIAISIWSGLAAMLLQSGAVAATRYLVAVDSGKENIDLGIKK